MTLRKAWRARDWRRAAAAIVCGAALTLSGCGFDADTLQPYTQADGVNAEAGDVKVRNLVVVSDGEGEGYLSGLVVSTGDDALVEVSGEAFAYDNAPAGPLEVDSGSIELVADEPLNLVDEGPITVSADGLAVGSTVELVLVFSSGARTEVTVPVVASDDPVFGEATPDSQS